MIAWFEIFLHEKRRKSWPLLISHAIFFVFFLFCYFSFVQFCPLLIHPNDARRQTLPSSRTTSIRKRKPVVSSACRALMHQSSFLTCFCWAGCEAPICRSVAVKALLQERALFCFCSLAFFALFIAPLLVDCLCVFVVDSTSPTRMLSSGLES